MSRPCVTQIFPWLFPIRRMQRLICFYTKMRFDGNCYATGQAGELLPHQIFETSCSMYNRDTGFDMVYQENKVFNLKLAAATLDRLVILPGETFSFWRLVRYADQYTPYKEGLAKVNGNLIPQQGGGLCQLSNLLFWMFLHTPLTIVERHGHRVKDFPEPLSDAVLGVDATVSEGWLDLRVRNDTDMAYQITLSFDREHIIGSVFTERDEGLTYQVNNGVPLYTREGAAVFEEVDVIQQMLDSATGQCVASKTMYCNRCGIGYPLPAGTLIMEKG